MTDGTRNPALARLDVLVGEWIMEAFVGGQSIGGVARTRFEWAEDGAFLVQHADGTPDETTSQAWVEHSPFPVTTMIGLDDSSGQYTQLYADARGVFRVYQMSLEDGVWTLWRAAPGFHQRSTATISEEGQTITGAWEASSDGTTWSLDFDYRYTKLTG